jgi:hypothetical protein
MILLCLLNCLHADLFHHAGLSTQHATTTEAEACGEVQCTIVWGAVLAQLQNLQGLHLLNIIKKVSS